MATETMRHYLNRVQKVAVIPASAIFTEDYIVNVISESSAMTFGDADYTLVKPSRLIPDEAFQDELGQDTIDILRYLEAGGVYIDLEN